jgi:hypothetical protein
MLISHLRFCPHPTTASAGRNSSVRALRLLAVAEDAIAFRFQVVQERAVKTLDGALYAVGLKPMMLTRLRPLVPYFAVSLLLAVLGRLEHPTIPNKDALAVIQSNR